jgi:hypothetical protein
MHEESSRQRRRRGERPARPHRCGEGGDRGCDLASKVKEERKVIGGKLGGVVGGE